MSAPASPTVATLQAAMRAVSVLKKRFPSLKAEEALDIVVQIYKEFEKEEFE